MLGKCNEHGYYRGRECPTCHGVGKFLMKEKFILPVSRLMVGILRHFPQKFGIEMDEHGWVKIKTLADVLAKRTKFGWLTEEHLRAISATDPNERYQTKDDLIRATYAHTIEVDLSDLPEADKAELFFPASPEEVELIKERGIYPTDQTYVHLSGTYEKALEAGKIHTPNPIILQIDAKKATEEGVGLKKAGKDIYLAKLIDKKYISETSKK
jgi:putative RNA 2'-phosphotransferase